MPIARTRTYLVSQLAPPTTSVCRCCFDRGAHTHPNCLEPATPHPRCSVATICSGGVVISCVLPATKIDYSSATQSDGSRADCAAEEVLRVIALHNNNTREVSVLEIIHPDSRTRGGRSAVLFFYRRPCVARCWQFYRHAEPLLASLCHLTGDKSANYPHILCVTLSVVYS